MKKLSLYIIPVIVFTMVAQAQTNTDNTSAVIVKTQNGTLEGTIENSGVRSFKGIPFATPPVGGLRWKEPQPPKNWEGKREAKHFSARAVQNNVFADMNFRSAGMSEDWLYLNVWIPPGRNKGLPVLVYFYGGGFVAGDGSEPRYDGESMAMKGIVSITVNYRLGIFGFMAHPELTRESAHHASGNYGLLDQHAALVWVQKNIAAFGGDPKRVTIAGESAGSSSVCAQMASPLSKNLFTAAIGESGSVLGTSSLVPLAKGEQTGVYFTSSIGLHSLAELRALPPDSLLAGTKKFGGFKFSITSDGYFFPKNPYNIFDAGEQAHVPLLAGWNSQEMDYHMIMGGEKPTKENFTKVVKKLYGDSATEALKYYNASTDAEALQVATDLSGDRFIAFNPWRWTDMQTKTGGKPVYRYLFSRARPGEAGAVHSAEIEYAMGNLGTNKTYAWTADDYKVSATMQAYFANFIKTMNPNGGRLPMWPAINKSYNVPVLHIDVNTRVELDQHRDRYLFLDRYAKK
jgi:para-nitrobenzyl esterase